jgi:SagB-type dehydrogenase family enzyme
MRRARSILVSWAGKELVLTNYLTGSAISADPESIRILHLLSDWTDPAALFARLPEYSRRSIRAGLRELRAGSLVVFEDSAEAERDAELVRVWSDWLPHGSFHFGTRDLDFFAPEETEDLFAEYLAKSRQPRLWKDYPRSKRIALPRVKAAQSEFTRVLMQRKTHRDFSGGKITLETISRLLYYTWGVTGRIEAPPFGDLFHKTSPSGGARHPGEVYLLALRVAGLERAAYHYDGLHHRLSRLGTFGSANRIAEIAAQQDFLANASALFIMTAVFPRVLWKYRFSRAYRIVLLDAGHLCQTFCLVATWLGLAPFCTAAFRDTALEKLIGVDGIRESALYIAGVGTVPAERLRKRR